LRKNSKKRKNPEAAARCEKYFLMEIIPNIHLIPGIIANPYLIIDPDGLTLIDTGLPGNEKKILKYITSLGFKPDDLKRIIITHADYDHIGGLISLRKKSSARIYASAIESAAMTTGQPSRTIQPKNILIKLVFMGMARMVKSTKIQADEILIDGQVLPIHGGLHVVETFGHTPGHISLFIPSAGVLFSGDSIVSEKDRLFASRQAVTWDRQKADESVRKQAGLGARIVCPGHGPVVMEAEDKFPVG
jgi:glyoxylase-like metal-dependent hydrolase (beta-lactamase superfamily II)